MKKRILFLISVFLFFTFIFLLFKSIFTLTFASSIGGGVSMSDFWQVLYHGLPLDLSMSAYLTLLPGLLTIASLWIGNKIVSVISDIYMIIILFVLVVVFVFDIVIYPNWGYHFDSSVFLYLESPLGSLASATGIEIILGAVSLVLTIGILFVGYRLLLARQIKNFNLMRGKQKIAVGIVLLLLVGSLILPIRGGVTVSTMNVGQAYFSSNMFLNHAAVNPHFNLMYSIAKSEDFASQYQFLEKEEATEIFDKLIKRSDAEPKYLLKTNRPNIVLFLLESFSANVAYDSIIAPNFVKMANEGVKFSNFYANSFRTDRGLVSMLSGYPAHPTLALMKYPKKTQTLPSIPSRLIDNGYHSYFYYGGDVDYASMRSYIIGTCGTSNITADKDFAMSKRMTKWGVPDEYLLDRVFDDLATHEMEEPFITTVLTLSSHEPFDVPTKKFDSPFLNSVNYTDEQLGKFAERLKEANMWDNTLIVLLADHCMQSYPAGVESNDAERFRIPLVWSGGAVETSCEVKDFGSQNNLSATLLGQLGIDYLDFKFSNDMLNPDSNKFAFYSYNNGFSMIDSTGVVIYDNESDKVIKHRGEDLEKTAKAFFQMMYLDLGER